jgi:hypothetical protein
MLPHFMVRFSGVFFRTDQTWSVGLRFRSATGGDPGGIADVETHLNAWRDGIKALHSGNVVPSEMQALMSTGCTLTAIRCSAINAQGHETAVSLVEKDPISTGTRQVVMPSQVAVAVTLGTGYPGASNRGRFYWPGLGAGVAQNGRQGNIDTQALATDVAGWIPELEGAGASVITPSLRLNVLSTTKATAKPVTEVRIGDRLDIQRRRADKEKETYSVAVVAE